MSPYPLIIDTNVLLDLFVFEDQRANFLQAEINGKKAQIVYCPEMIEEFADVLSRTQFNLSDEEQKEILPLIFTGHVSKQAHVLLML